MIILSGQDDKPRFLSRNLEDLVIDEPQAVKEEEDDDENEGITPAVEAEKLNTEKPTSAVVFECTTPTAKEYRIPDVMTCPPAPMKRKVSSLSVKTHNFSNKIRVVKKFFASPEIEAMLGINNRISSKISWSSRRHLRQEKS